MSALGLVFGFALLAVGVVTLALSLLGRLWRWARRIDPPFEPQAAEAPDRRRGVRRRPPDRHRPYAGRRRRAARPGPRLACRRVHDAEGLMEEMRLSHRGAEDHLLDDLDAIEIDAALDDAHGNLWRLQCLTAEGASQEQVEAALDLCYEQLRTRLTGQQMIRAVLLLIAEARPGAPKEQT